MVGVGGTSVAVGISVRVALGRGERGVNVAGATVAAAGSTTVGTAVGPGFKAAGLHAVKSMAKTSVMKTGVFKLCSLDGIFIIAQISENANQTWLETILVLFV